jgi:hypothetical protein
MRTRRSWRNQERLWKALGKEKQPELNCRWIEDEEGNWNTQCGQKFTWTVGTPSDNGARWCLYCGKALKEIKYVVAADENQ